MLIVAALGGNALMRRDESLDAEVAQPQREGRGRRRWPRSRAITSSSSPTATARRSACSRCRARRSATSARYPLDVLGAESEGMIGYVLEQRARERVSAIARSHR